MLNKVFLIGRLGAKPKIRYIPQNIAVTTFPLATNEIWVEDGKRQEHTEWHNIVVFGRLAEICGDYLSKGSLVYIEGSLRTRSWYDKNDNRHYTTEIIAKTVKFLSSKKQSSSSITKETEEVPEIPEVPSEEDLPF